MIGHRNRYQELQNTSIREVAGQNSSNTERRWVQAVYIFLRKDRRTAHHSAKYMTCILGYNGQK